MFRKAAALHPDLIAASDGILMTGRTTGGKTAAKAEFAVSGSAGWKRQPLSNKIRWPIPIMACNHC
jgi:hypothetical protein